MAMIPSRDTTVLSATSTDILNAIRNTLGGGYATSVPIADGSDANLQRIGTAIIGNADIRNQFVGMLNAIGLTIIKSAIYYNEWADAKLGTMEYGEIAREAFVEIVMPHLYNPNAGADEYFAWDKPKVEEALHFINYKTFYKIPISRFELRKAFSYASGVEDLLSNLISRAEVSEQYDEYLAMRYIVARNIVDGHAKINHIDVITKENASDVAEDILAISDDLDFMSRDYNAAGVLRTFPKSEQWVIMTPRAKAVQNVNVLANAFNLNKVEWSGVQKRFDRLVPTEEEYERMEQLFPDKNWYRRFTSDEETFLNTISIMMMSKDKLMVLDTVIESESANIGETMMQFFWYHHHKIMSDSPFGMLIAFSTAEMTVTAVTINPASVTQYKKGQSYQFTATVTGSVGIDKSVTWEISGENSPNTYINENGLLYIAPDENAATITVRAVANQDGTTAKTASVTLA